MDAFFSSALDSGRSVPLQGTAIIVVLVLGILIILGRWGIVLTTLLTLGLGLIAHNLIVMDERTAETVIGVPEAIYLLGGIAIGIWLLVRFIRFMIT